MDGNKHSETPPVGRRLGFLRLLQEAGSFDVPLDFGGGQNEAELGRLPGLLHHLKVLMKQRCLFEIRLLADFAFGLEAQEELDGALEIALDASGVAGEAIKILPVLEIRSELMRVGAMQPPLAVGDGLNDVHFGDAAGLPFLRVIVAMRQVQLHVLMRHNDDLTGEAVADGVEAGALFSVVGTWSGAVLRVGAICLDLNS